jgi:hypothetical protein
MLRITVTCEAELAGVIHRDAGVPKALADEFAGRASCGEIVQFAVQTEVLGYQPSGRAYSLTEVTTVWQAIADETWELRKVEG